MVRANGSQAVIDLWTEKPLFAVRRSSSGLYMKFHPMVGDTNAQQS
jgi:hypothetical protein